MKLLSKVVVAVLACLLFHTVEAQQVAMPEVMDFLKKPVFAIDTTLRQRGYLLTQKDVDDESSLYSYSSMERPEDDGPAVARSLTIVDASSNGYTGRMITYRTYSADEYRDMMGWLLLKNYKLKDQYDFGDSKQLVYENGTNSIRVKINTVKLKTGRTFTAYEVEVGR